MDNHIINTLADNSIQCLATMIRGELAGQRCPNKVSKHGYCSNHLKNKRIKQELADRGIDINAPSEIQRPTRNRVSFSDPSISNDPLHGNSSATKQETSIINVVPPRIPGPAQNSLQANRTAVASNAAQRELEEENQFAAVFSSQINQQLENGSFSLDSIYDTDLEFDDSINVSVNAIPPSFSEVRTSRRAPPRINSVVNPQSGLTSPAVHPVEDVEEEEESYVAPATERKQSAAYITKTCLTVAVSSLAMIAEASCAPHMNGYHQHVLTLPDMNTILDEMAIKYDDEIGLNKLPVEMRLLALMGAGAANCYANNLRLAAQQADHIPSPINNNYGYQQQGYNSAPSNVMQQSSSQGGWGQPHFNQSGSYAPAYSD